LLLEKFPAGHADDARFDAFGGEFFVGFDAEADFAASAHEDYLWLATRSISET